MRCVLTTMIVLCAGLTACDDDGGGSGGDAGLFDVGGMGGGGAGGVDVPPGVEIVGFDTGLPDALSLAALGEAGINTACTAVGAYEARFAADLQPLRCLSFGVDTALAGTRDPAVCLRLNDLCLTVPYTPDDLAQSCVDDFSRLPNWCRPGTVGDFEACIARNIGLERAAADNANLTCEEGIARGSVLPEGLWHCACNVPEFHGPPPLDDADRDGVVDADDLCPHTGPHAVVNATGCSALEDLDGDGVPNVDDLCRDSVGPVSVDGCDLMQDPDQDRVLGSTDICPGTAPGAEVSALGCSVDQDEDQDNRPDATDPCPGSMGPVNDAGCDAMQDLDDDGVPNEVDPCPGSMPGALTTGGCDRMQDVDADGVPNAEDQCDNTFPQVTGVEVNAFGCSRQQDRDYDGVGNERDRCDDTPAGVAIGPSGCSAAQDLDQDQVGNIDDVCPSTPEGEPVDFAGCAVWQYDVLGFPVAALPADTRAFIYEPDGQPPIALHAVEQTIFDDADGADVRGTLYLGLPDGTYLPLPRADVRLPIAPGGRGIGGISGSIDLALPGLDVIPGVRINEPVRASVRFDSGGPLLDRGVDAPLDRARPYLVFELDAGVSVTLGQAELSVGAQADIMVVMDPFDPGFFGRFDVRGVPFFDNMQDVAVGVSRRGRLPFEPFEDGVFQDGARPIPAFEGNLLLDGAFDLGGFLPLPGIVVEAIGEAVVDLDPHDDGRSALQGGPVRVGVNGELEVGVNILDQFRLTVPIARGTVSYGDPASATELVIAGSVGVDALRFPIGVPVEPAAEVYARIEAGQRIERLRVLVGGRLTFLAATLPGIGRLFDVQNVEIDGAVEASINGVLITGSTNQSPIDAIDFIGRVSLFANFPVHGDWIVRLDGRMRFEGREVHTVVIGSGGIDVD